MKDNSNINLNDNKKSEKKRRFDCVFLGCSKMLFFGSRKLKVEIATSFRIEKYVLFRTEKACEV